jgi:hypothetical protein
MNANAASKSLVGGESGQPVQDEWDAFAPRRGGLPDATQPEPDQRPVTAATIADSDPAAPGPLRSTHCAFCSEPLSPTSQYCSRCLRPISEGKTVTPEAAGLTPASGKAHTGAGALYTLESPVRCPECENEIRSIRVIRVLRTQVSFTSTLPRKGYVIVCPECERVLSAELSGLI